MATEKFEPWLEAEKVMCRRIMKEHADDADPRTYELATETRQLLIDASTHLCVATLNRLAAGTQTELKGCGKYEPLLDNLRMLRLMQ